MPKYITGYYFCDKCGSLLYYYYQHKSKSPRCSYCKASSEITIEPGWKAWNERKLVEQGLIKITSHNKLNKGK